MSSRSWNLLRRLVRNARTAVYPRRPRFPRRATRVAELEALSSFLEVQHPCAGDAPMEKNQWVAGIIVTNLLRISSEPKRVMLVEPILCRKFIRLVQGCDSPHISKYPLRFGRRRKVAPPDEEGYNRQNRNREDSLPGAHHVEPQTPRLIEMQGERAGERRVR